MSSRKDAEEIIRTLQDRAFYAQCLCCEDPILLKKAGLFYLDELTPSAQEIYNARLQLIKDRALALKKRKIDMPRSSETTTRAVNLGFILERLCPCFEDFCFDRSDCRFLFDPIDYVIFEGLSKGGSIERIVFTDIKTGRAELSKKQKQIKELINTRKVAWDTYTPKVTP